MRAFLNDPELKTGLVAEVRKHREQDQIIKGTYGKMNGVWKGCAVGCSIRSFNLLRGTDHDTSDHAVYEQFGIPQWLARVQDTIFEGLPEERSVLWPEEFWTAIVPGADLDKVKTPFILFILRSNLKNFDHAKFPDVKAAIDGVIALYESGEPSESAAWSAGSAAWSAWESAAAWAAESAAAWAAYVGFANKLLELLSVNSR